MKNATVNCLLKHSLKLSPFSLQPCSHQPPQCVPVSRCGKQSQLSLKPGLQEQVLRKFHGRNTLFSRSNTGNFERFIQSRMASPATPQIFLGGCHLRWEKTCLWGTAIWEPILPPTPGTQPPFTPAACTQL